ncbi:MAG: hypothetical protein RR177_05620 [Oscillospiraceae bacterium]
MKSVIKIIINLVVFCVCLACIVIGQLNKGPQWLGLMLIGLAGLLVLLFFYNRKYTEADRNAKKLLKEQEKKDK